MENIKNHIYLFILLAAPILSFIWHYENNHLPMSDAIAYLESAQLIYQNFRDSEFLSFIVSIFNERSWRPVIFQVFIVPFLIISEGNLLASVLMTHVLFTSLSVYFVYKIFLMYAGKYISAVSASIVCLSVDIFFGGEAFPLFAEISFLPFLLGTIYFLSKDSLFKNKKRSFLFIIFFTLTLLSRPVEGVLFLSISLLTIMFYKHSKYLSLYEIVKGFTYPIFFFWLLFISRLVPKVSSSVLKIDPPYSYEVFLSSTIFVSLLLLLMLFLIHVLKKKGSIKTFKSIDTFFSRSMLISSIILWIWYTPRFGSLYGWVYSTSLGNQFQYLKDQSYEPLELIISAINGHGSFIIYLIIFLFVISIFLSLMQNKFNQSAKDFFDKKLNSMNLLILTAIPLPIILYFTTHQVSYRKIGPVITLLLIIFLSYIIRVKKFRDTFYTILTSLFLLQSFTLYSYISISENDKWSNNQKSYLEKKILGSHFPVPININFDVHSNLVAFLKDRVKEKNIKDIALVLDDSAYPVEPYLIKFLCYMDSFKCSFSSPKKFKFGDLKYLEGYDSLLIVNSNNIELTKSKKVANLVKDKISLRINKSSPSELYAYYIHYIYALDDLSSHNIEEVGCTIIYKNFTACLLIKL